MYTEPIKFKTGQRVKVQGTSEDQHGCHSYHLRHGTFPPCVHTHECAFRTLVRADDYDVAA